MAFEDLDLEFEDEEEKKKKNDAMAVDVDLEFQVPDTTKRPPVKPGPPPMKGPSGNSGPPRPVIQTGAGPGVEARPVASNVKPLPQAKASVTGRPSPPKLVGTSALKEDLDDVESLEVLELREKVRKTEFDADVRVAIAEYKTEHLSELLSDMKLMDHQVNQLLVRINAKHPDLKQEVLMIKKLLADFTAKKRK